MKNFKGESLRIITHLGALAPLVLLIWDYYNHKLTANPIQALEQRTGRTAIALLTLSLLCSPLFTLIKFPPVIRQRRTLGLYTFFYAFLHFLIYVVLDFGLDFGIILQELTQRPYLIIGGLNLIILTALAVTSFKYWERKMKRNWTRLHRFAYLSGVLAVLHYAMALKGDILRLRGNIYIPVYYAIVLSVLLIMRIPAVRRIVSRIPIRLR
jgi:sulfoxide reductase heme-binding subunit YedZ